jgi:hypothetical protein
MLQISEKAKIMLKDSLDSGSAEGQVYRLVRDGEQLVFGIAAIEDGDEVYKLNGEAVMAAPSDLAGEFEGTIDVEQTSEGSKLVLAT